MSCGAYRHREQEESSRDRPFGRRAWGAWEEGRAAGGGVRPMSRFEPRGTLCGTRQQDSGPALSEIPQNPHGASRRL